MLQDKKQELQKLRDVRLRGELVRSRLQWLKEGERPSKFFCNLESQNFIDKTMKKIQLNNGSVVTDQKEVLHHVRKFYSNLFESRDQHIADVNFAKRKCTFRKRI